MNTTESVTELMEQIDDLTTQVYDLKSEVNNLLQSKDSHDALMHRS